jgi:DNA-binding FadR family transcriptional regulator
VQITAEAFSYVDAVERELKRSILVGELGTGTRLPPERVLSERFGVNRVTVRAALARLRDAGLVEVRQGRGYTVLDFRRTANLDLLGDVVGLGDRGNRIELATDLLRLRRSLVLAVVDALDPTPKNLEAIRTAVNELEDRKPELRSANQVVEADFEVAKVAVDCTRSLVLRMFLNPLLHGMQKFPELSYGAFPSAEKSLRTWRLFVQWLESEGPDPALLLSTMKAADEETLSFMAKQRSPKARR